MPPPPPPTQSQSCSAAPESPGIYHLTCRKSFVNQRSLETIRRQVEDCGEAVQNQHQLRRIARDTQGSSANPAVLPDTCVFCKKTKYKPETRTREPLRSPEEFRADKKVKEGFLLHIKCHTKMSCIATEISGICAKDLISSEAKYYTTCYNGFVRIMHKNDKATESSTETSTNNHGIDEAYEAIYAFCETMISNPRVIEFKEIRKVLADEAERLGVAVTQSQ